MTSKVTITAVTTTTSIKIQQEVFAAADNVFDNATKPSRAGARDSEAGPFNDDAATPYFKSNHRESD